MWYNHACVPFNIQAIVWGPFWTCTVLEPGSAAFYHVVPEDETQVISLDSRHTFTVESPQIFRLYFYGTVLDLQRKWKSSHKLCPHPHSHFNPCYCIGMIYLLQMMDQNWHIYQLKSIIHIRVHSPCLSLSGLCACVCVPMCSCVFTYVETSSWHQVSSSTPLHLCFEKNVSYWSGAHKFGYTSWSGIHMLPPPCAGTAGVSLCICFNMGAGKQTQALTLVQQAF